MYDVHLFHITPKPGYSTTGILEKLKEIGSSQGEDKGAHVKIQLQGNLWDIETRLMESFDDEDVAQVRQVPQNGPWLY